MKKTTLQDWLAYIECLHPKTIALGLERVVAVKARLGLDFPAILITVGGTNGKGSVAAMLEAILLAAGYRVGTYTSPHLQRYNERVRVNGMPVEDEQLCAAFACVESARQDAALTYFEFGTLAAWAVFATSAPDVLVLEVGLGGRLDAVNAFDADCAVITSIAMDHTDYLGDTREMIGFEKAGIMRSARPVIVGDPAPPASVIEHAAALGADLQYLGRDFGFIAQQAQWQFWGRQSRRGGLAHPALRGAHQLSNASACLAALDTLSGRLPISMQAVRLGLATAAPPARFEVLPGRPTVVLDVAHNSQAAEALAANLASMGFYRRTYAVFGMLRDKDIRAVCAAVRGQVSTWMVAGLDTPRGADAATVARAVREAESAAEVVEFDRPQSAYAAARGRADENDRIIVFGSFYTVADVMAARAAGVEFRSPIG